MPRQTQRSLLSRPLLRRPARPSLAAGKPLNATPGPAARDHDRRIGSRVVSGIGLGAMHLSVAGRPDRAQALSTVRAAVEAGVTLIDTADSYSLGADDLHHNEALVAEALLGMGSLGRCGAGGDEGRTHAARRQLGRRRPSGTSRGRPAAGRCALWVRTASASTSCTGRTRTCRTRSRSGALKRSAATPAWSRTSASATRRSAHIRTALQVLGTRRARRRAERALTACAPRVDRARRSAPGSASPTCSTARWAAQACGAHLHGAPVLDRIARAHKVSPQQVALAWELTLGEHVVPIPGCSRPETARDSALAVRLRLTPSEPLELQTAFPLVR